jgi:predicted nucleic acid-binding protein
MGSVRRVAEWRGSRVYLDTNVFVYAFEGFPDYLVVLRDLFDLIDRREIEAVTSELALAEALVRPMTNGNVEAAAAYERAFRESESLRVQPVSRDVLIAAARLRAALGVSLPDAIHAATAQLASCAGFLTNDKRLRSIPDLTVIQLSEFVTPGVRR